MDEVGPRSRSDFSPEPNCRRTKFCLEQISLMFCKVKGDVGGIYGRGDPPVIALARSSHPYLCSLIPSQPHVETFHNKSSDFSNYLRIVKPSSYLFSHLVVTCFAHSPLQLFFFLLLGPQNILGTQGEDRLTGRAWLTRWSIFWFLLQTEWNVSTNWQAISCGCFPKGGLHVTLTELGRR